MINNDNLNPIRLIIIGFIIASFLYSTMIIMAQGLSSNIFCNMFPVIIAGFFICIFFIVAFSHASPYKYIFKKDGIYLVYFLRIHRKQYIPIDTLKSIKIDRKRKQLWTITDIEVQERFISRKIIDYFENYCKKHNIEIIYL